MWSKWERAREIKLRSFFSGGKSSCQDSDVKMSSSLGSCDDQGPEFSTNDGENSDELVQFSFSFNGFSVLLHLKADARRADLIPKCMPKEGTVSLVS